MDEQLAPARKPRLTVYGREGEAENHAPGRGRRARRKKFRQDSSQVLEKSQNREGNGNKRPIKGPFAAVTGPLPTHI